MGRRRRVSGWTGWLLPDRGEGIFHGMSEIRPYCPLSHAEPVFSLWGEALGNVWPIAQRAFFSRVTGRIGYRQGDAVVALMGSTVVGFGMVEVHPGPNGAPPGGSISCLVTAPGKQGQGIGTELLAALEDRLRSGGCGEVRLGGGRDRFWTGVPENLPDAMGFFEARGYYLSARMPDMLHALEACEMTDHYRERLDEAGAVVRSAAWDDVGALLAMERREFPGWVDNLLRALAAGDVENIILVECEGEIIGAMQSFTPQGQFRGANQVWEEILGTAVGGYGAVGIAKAWRGRGLGGAMSLAAAEHVRSHGASACCIDWVGPVGFYEKLGASVWQWFRGGSKTLS